MSVRVGNTVVSPLRNGGGTGTSDYTDLTNKPSINNVTLSGNKSLSDLGIQPAGNYANVSDIPDVSDFITKSVNNLTYYTLKTDTGSLIDLEINSTTYVVTLSLKDIDGNVISTDTIDLPLESVVVNGSYDSTNQKIVLTLQSGNTVDVPVGALIAGLQTEITSSNKLASDLVDDTNSGNKFVSSSEKTTWNAKYNKPSTGIPSSDMSSEVQSSLSKADTALQSHQDISGKVDKVTGKELSSNDFTNTYKDNVDSNTNARHTHSNKSTLDGISSTDITNWNGKGTYSKPNGGIPKTDLASDIQTSLGKADTAIQSHQDISGKLDITKFYNDYYFGMPTQVSIKENTTVNYFPRNILTSNYLLRWGNYTGNTNIRNCDDDIEISVTTKSTKNIQYSVFDRNLNKIEDGTTELIIKDTPPVSQTMLMLGDSFITQGYIEPDLRALFTADNRTLTLMGTKGSGDNKNEGYAGWKYTDFMNASKSSTTNPFYDGSKFNFSYYMQQNSFSSPDSVYIQLGTNDASATTPNQDFTDTLNASQTIINSILEYNSNIKIYLGLTVMPTLKSTVFANSYNGVGWNWIMRANMQKLNKLLIDKYKNNSSVKIVPTNLALDSTSDINDNVHPNSSGYQKMAEQVYYTMMTKS